MIVTLDLDDEVYELARAEAKAEFVSVETWIAYNFEKSVNLRKGHDPSREDSPPEI
jgi:predicted HicB family RNase H-like nuclease